VSLDRTKSPSMADVLETTNSGSEESSLCPRSLSMWVIMFFPLDPTGLCETFFTLARTLFQGADAPKGAQGSQYFPGDTLPTTGLGSKSFRYECTEAKLCGTQPERDDSCM